MSDLILKFWPKDDSTENNIEIVKKVFIEKEIIGNEVEIWGRTAHKSNKNIRHYFKPNWQFAEQYFSNTHVIIKGKGYNTVFRGIETAFLDRNTVVELHNVDGTISEWKDFVDLLSEITGVEYEGNWGIS